MIIPYGTDAPVYHWPVGTVVLMGLNVVAYFLWWAGVIPDQLLDSCLLSLGNGLHPVQWIPSTFLHFNLLQLIEHLAFLWIFGLIVEGKLGRWKFLACYLGLGLEVSALEQSLSIFIDYQGIVFGPAGILFALLGMAIIWAPNNQVGMGWVFGARSHGSILVRNLGFIYLFLEVGLALLLLFMAFGRFELDDFRPGRASISNLLHIIGLVAGVPLGIILLKYGTVDCQGWDIFSLRRTSPRWGKKYRPGRLEGPEFEETKANALDLMREYLGERDPSMAAAVYRQSVAEAGAWGLPMDVLNGLIDGFTEAGKLSEARPFIEEAIPHDPQNAVDRTLLLARACLEGDRDPVKGLEVLISLPESLNESRAAQRDRLFEEASRIEVENQGPSAIAS